MRLAGFGGQAANGLGPDLGCFVGATGFVTNPVRLKFRVEAQLCCAFFLGSLVQVTHPFLARKIKLLRNPRLRSPPKKRRFLARVLAPPGLGAFEDRLMPADTL